MLNKQSTKQQTFAQLSSKQMSKIYYKNIRAYPRYCNFRVDNDDDDERMNFNMA